MNENIKFENLMSCAFSERYNLPKSSCVYFVFLPNDNLQYIGASRKLKYRILQNEHIEQILSKTEPQNIVIRYLPVYDITELFQIEASCIKRFRPRLNKFSIKPPLHNFPEKEIKKEEHISFDTSPIDNFYKSKFDDFNY